MATRKRGRTMVLVAIIALVCTASTSVRAEEDEFGADYDDGPSSSAPPPSSSGATEMTGDELAGSIHSGADVVPHLVKFYAPWCSKCRQMSSDFDAAADRLTRGVNAGTNKFVVASVAEASTGARKLRRLSAVPNYSDDWRDLALPGDEELGERATSREAPPKQSRRRTKQAPTPLTVDRVS